MKRFFLLLIFSTIMCHLAFSQSEKTELSEPTAMATQDINYYMITAYIMYDSARWMDAIQHCNQCIALKPLCFRAILLRGCAKLQLGLERSGWEDIILTLDPDACRIGCHHEDLDDTQKERLLEAAHLIIEEQYYSVRKIIEL